MGGGALSEIRQGVDLVIMSQRHVVDALGRYGWNVRT